MIQVTFFQVMIISLPLFTSENPLLLILLFRIKDLSSILVPELQVAAFIDQDVALSPALFLSL